MITSSFPETNRSFKSGWFKRFHTLCYPLSEDSTYCLACVLFCHRFPEKPSEVKNFYFQTFRHWPVVVSACKVQAEEKKKRKERRMEVSMNRANHFIVKHTSFLVISWII